MGSQERMTEQKGERIGGKTQLIPERWEGRRLCGDRVVFYHHCACELSLGACPNPPGHPPAPGLSGTVNCGTGMHFGTEIPFPMPSQTKGSLVRSEILFRHLHPGKRHLGGQDQRSCGW